MPILKEPVKLFILQLLACHNTPSEVANAVKEEFDIDVHRSQVAAYDPSNYSGRELSAKLKEFFYQKRKEFLDNIYAIPMANASVRINELNKMFYEAKKRKNYVLAMQLSEQIAKEEGGFYTNRLKLGTDANDPFVEALRNFNGGSMPIVHDVEVEFTEVKEVKTTKPEKKVIAKKTTKNVDWNVE